jgi:putative ABC transport system permease protein
MVFLENFRIALAALRANKMRSILTTLGIIIGVAAVIAVVSIVQGLQYMIARELQGVGATYMMVFPDMQQQGPGVVARQVKLTWEDGQAIQQRVPGVRLITPVVAGRAQVKYRDRKHDPSSSWASTRTGRR